MFFFFEKIIFCLSFFKKQLSKQIFYYILILRIGVVLMIIYVIHEQKLFNMTLPLKINGSYSLTDIFNNK